MAKDPICGMIVDETKALSAERDGHTYYFCSAHCRENFLAQSSPPASKQNEPHSCCGGGAQTPPAARTGETHDHHRNHDDAHGHHADHEAALKPSAKAKYFCPMCLGVESDQPG